MLMKSILLKLLTLSNKMRLEVTVTEPVMSLKTHYISFGLLGTLNFFREKFIFLIASSCSALKCVTCMNLT